MSLNIHVRISDEAKDQLNAIQAEMAEGREEAVEAAILLADPVACAEFHLRRRLEQLGTAAAPPPGSRRRSQ